MCIIIKKLPICQYILTPSQHFFRGLVTSLSICYAINLQWHEPSATVQIHNAQQIFDYLVYYLVYYYGYLQICNMMKQECIPVG